MSEILPIIVAGGSGSRLWPLSRELYPKQFLALNGKQTMLQQTVSRLASLNHNQPIFICNEEHRFIVAEQLREHGFKKSNILLEPISKNTAPAIALAAIYSINQGEDPLLLILPADHLIENHQVFINAVTDAITYAQSGKFVTFGIAPKAPETGYGYIKRGTILDNNNAYKVSEFIEKPDLATARRYLNSANYLWNSGIFMFKASCYIKELKINRPEMLEYCQAAMERAEYDLDFIRPNQESFKACQADSIDYAVMEHVSDAIVITIDTNWSDLGSFNALWSAANKDTNCNVVDGDILLEHTKNSYLYSQNKLVAAVGVNNLVVIETKDAVLVAHKDRLQDIKGIVNQLKQAKRSEHLQHRKAYRPWGSHDEIANGDRFQVKHIIIKPAECTATQMHYHRTKHWVVVRGAAKVTNNNKDYIVAENESIYITAGSGHCIENPGKIDLHIIEVSSGSYLSEDDIVRLVEYHSKQ